MTNEPELPEPKEPIHSQCPVCKEDNPSLFPVVISGESLEPMYIHLQCLMRVLHEYYDRTRKPLSPEEQRKLREAAQEIMPSLIKPWLEKRKRKQQK